MSVAAGVRTGTSKQLQLHCLIGLVQYRCKQLILFVPQADAPRGINTNTVITVLVRSRVRGDQRPLAHTQMHSGGLSSEWSLSH